MVALTDAEKKKLKYAYTAKQIPLRYVNETLEATTMAKTQMKILDEKLYRAPSSGVLLITGTAGPIVNHLWQQGRKVVGMSFVEYFDGRFSDEKLVPLKADVVVLHGVGSEADGKKEFSSTLLTGIMDIYKNRETLLIIETHMTPTTFAVTYGRTITNAKTVTLHEEEKWI